MTVQGLVDGHPSSNRLDGQRRRHGALLSVAALVVLLLSHGVEQARGFAYVPVVNTFARVDTSGNKVESRLVCQEGGGYIAGEPTAAAHTAVIQAVRGAGAGTEWYAYLGASTHDNPPPSCPPPLSQQVPGTPGGASFGCYWRWNQGRWTETDDNPALPLYVSHVGVTFYVGNYYADPSTSVVTVYGPQGNFPTWFNHTTPKTSQNRPSAMFGQELLSVGNGDASSWSDNENSGGYSYASFLFSTIYNTSRFNPTAKAATMSKFWAVCQTQGPSRMMYESQNTSSDLQNRWWVIFFVILLVLCLVAFIVTACCQDHEDMDEPPEDAPEWAQEETQQATRTKSFVSTRSFVQHDSRRGSDDGSGDDGGSAGGSQRSGNLREDDGASVSKNGDQQFYPKKQVSMYQPNNTQLSRPASQYANRSGVNSQAGNGQGDDGSRMNNNWM
ncbi:hypothetical protein NESM_000853600 [Novymonas esmeraldas]|uniref:Uncharacterized protein n=1 Tax=Novymonas esmeraldas TaxID=1808958 RepID=A0AAW0EZ74_9TRYP